MVHVAAGANDVDVDAGLTVQQIREEHAETLNISDGEIQIRLNGQAVGPDYVTQEGDEIEFVRPAGSKG